MKARAVIGANFGDEGKGLVTDMLCHQGADVVVRYNGGAQAGHTVVTPEGRRHVFSHFGSGSFSGVPTYFSEFFILNPIVFFEEADRLSNQIVKLPKVYAHPKCLVSTFADMLINRKLEDVRGTARHGSCGLGVGETYDRSKIQHLQITMADLWNGSLGLERKLEEICDKYAKYRIGEKIHEPDMVSSFLRGCEKFAEVVEPLGIQQCTNPVFEGAQGLLLDQGNTPYLPYLTRSNTGMKNVWKLCSQAGIDKSDVEIFYVTRSYLTRHGAGPLPGEDTRLKFPDDTNKSNHFQGNLRFAKFSDSEWLRLRMRCSDDSDGAGKGNAKLVITHCDQLPPFGEGQLYSFGPRRVDIRTTY